MHRSFSLAVSLSLLAACGGKIAVEDSATEPQDTESTPGDSESTPGDSEGEDSEGDSGDTQPPGEDHDSPQIEDIGWRVHDDIRSILYVGWDQLTAADAYVEYSFDKGEWHQTPTQSLGKGSVEVMLLGIPYESEVSFRIVNDFGYGARAGEEQAAANDSHPRDLPLPTLESGDETRWDSSGKYLYTSINEDTGGWTGGTYWQFIMDRQGRVVWAMETPNRSWTIFVRLGLNGKDLLWDEATYWSGGFGAGEDGMIHRMKIDGSIVESYEAPGLHHAFTELADGSIAWGAATSEYNEYLKIMRPDGSVEDLWDCFSFERQAGGSARYCQSNTLYWDEAKDVFLYSFYTSSTVVEIDAQTGENLHWWGDISEWSFDPSDSAFHWQHGVNYVENGNLLLSTHSSRRTDECATREYELDKGSDVLREVWSFGVDEGLDCDTAGEAHRLPNGNTLHNYGSGARLREVTEGGEIVWDVSWPDGQSRGRLMGRSVFMEDLYAFAP